MRRWSLRTRGIILVLLAMTLMLGCSGPEQKKVKFYNRGKAYYEKADYVKAGLEFKNALQIDPKFADAWYMMGMVALKRGEFSQAYGNLSKAAELAPEHNDAQAQVGSLLLLAREVDKAEEKAKLVLKRDPAHKEALLLQGGIYLARKETDTAVPFLEGLIAKDMKTPDVYLMLASAFSQKSSPKDAEKALQDGITVNPKSTVLRFALADFYLRSKQVDLAVQQFEKVLEYEPNNA